MEAAASGFPDGPVHPLDRTVRSKVSGFVSLWLMLFCAGEFGGVGAEQLLALRHLPDLIRVPTGATWLGDTAGSGQTREEPSSDAWALHRL
jgi:hypothetical protein